MSVATGSQSSRPSKRFRSAGPEDSHLASSPVAPQTVPNKRALHLPGAASTPQRPASRESTVSRSHTDSAPIAPMAPMAPMDSPTTAVLGSPVEEEISVSIEETVTTTQTPAASLLGGLKNRFVGVLTGQKPAIAPEAIIAGRKRSIDEVEDSVTAIVQDPPTQTRRVESPVVAATRGDDTAIELENQLHDASEPSDAQPNQKTGSAPTASSPAPKSRSASTANEIVAVNGSRTDTNAGPTAFSESISNQDSAPPNRASTAAISKRKSLAKTSASTAPEPAPKAEPAPRKQRARKSFTVTESPAAVAETAADTAGPSLVAETSDEPNENGEFEIDRITDHRHNADDPTLLDVQVSWKTNKPDGEYTWEPEANVQEDAPDALFQYWRSVKGGRNSALKNPDMWHVLRIEKHQVAKSGDVSVYVAWIGSPQRSWEPEIAVAGYASEHLDEYWETQGGRDIVLGAQSVSSAPKRRGRPPKSAASKAATAPASAKQVNAKATAKKQAPVATSKRQQRGANEKEAKAEAAPAPASGRTTRSSKR